MYTKFIQRKWLFLSIFMVVMASLAFVSLGRVSAAPASTVPFIDGFEAVNFNLWDTHDSRWSISEDNAHGTSLYKAEVYGDTGSMDDSLQKIISTAGYQSLVLSYWFRITGLDVGDHVYAEWSGNGGTTWNQLTDYTNRTADVDWVNASFSLPAGASNNSNFRFRFRAKMNSNTDIFMLDDVSLTGLQIPSAVNSSVNVTTPISADGGQSTIVILLKDSGNNPIVGMLADKFAIEVSGTGNAINPVSVSTDINGRTTASVSSTVAGQKTVKVTVNGVVLNSQPLLTVNPGVAMNATITANPGTTIEADLSGASVLLGITVTDGHGNLVPNETPVYLVSDLGTISGSGNTNNGVVNRVLTYNNKGTAHLSFTNLVAYNDKIIYFVDRTKPVIDSQSDITTEATSHSGAVVTYPTPLANDNIDGTVLVSCLPISGSTFSLGDHTVTCTTADSAGNTQSMSFDVEITDTTDPTITAPANITAEATAELTPVVLGIPVVSDIADSNPTVTNNAPVAGFPVGTTVVTWTVTDDSGNYQTANQNVTITDLTAPVITAPDDQIFEATGPITNPVLVPATATDNSDTAPVIVYVPNSFPIGTTEVTWTATDKYNNSSSITSQVTIKDTIKPIIDSHANITAEATSPAGATVSYTAPMSHDLVDGDILSSCDVASDSTFSLGDTTITCSKTDANGNVATPVTFVVTVQDTTAPAISSHADVTAEATSPSGAIVTYVLPTATDIVDLTASVSCSPVSGSQFALGTTIVSCSSTDSHINTATSQFNVIVQDTTIPTITAPANITAEAIAELTPVTLGTPVVIDIADSNPIVTNNVPAAGFPVGTTVVIWTVTDHSGNSQTANQNVIITDLTAPVITAPVDQTFEATGPLTIPVLVSATAIDNSDTAPVITYVPNSFPVGTTEVTWTATDKYGNNSSTTSNVTITDLTAPIIDSHANITAEATSPAGATVSYTAPMSRDLVDGDIQSSCDVASDSTFSLGNTTITCSKTDAKGNIAAPVTFTITVQDTSAPAISSHADVTAEATSPSGAIVTYVLPTATDIVDLTASVSCSPVSGSQFALGTTIVSCSSTDSHSNTATSQFNVIVQDTTAPTITAPADINMPANAWLSTVALGTPVVSDAVDTAPVVTNNAPATFPVGTTVVTWTVTDSSNNYSTATQNVTIVPAPIAQLDVNAETPKTTDEVSLVTVNGKDAFGHITTNQSGSIVTVNVDNGGSLSSSIITLANGVAITNLSKLSAGIVNINVISGILTPDSTKVTFTAADTSGPVVTQINPLKDAVNVAISSPLFLIFNEPLKSESISSANIKLMKVATGTMTVDEAVSASVSLSEGDVRVNINPNSSLDFSSQYYFIVSGVADKTGNVMTVEIGKENSGFTTVADTADHTAPTVATAWPSGSAVEINVNPYVDFSETMKLSSLTEDNIRLFKVGSTVSVPAVVVVQNGGTRVEIQPVLNLDYETAYYISVSANVSDEAGNKLSADYVSAQFTTITEPTAELVVTNIANVKSWAVAGGGFTQGWKWRFDVTVPTAEEKFFMRFNDWTNGASGVIPANGNIRYYTAQGDHGIDSPITVTGNGYPITPIILNSDLDTSSAGKQIQVYVEVQVPEGSAGGSYSTSYQVKSEELIPA